MLKNYLKIVLRNIKRHKGYSFINIAGLAIGMACAVLILLWVQDELSYDRFHENGDDIYRVVADVTFANNSYHSVIAPPPLAPALKDEFPEIMNSTRFRKCERMVLKYGERAFYEDDIVFVDPSFLEMFTFSFIKGNPETALQDPFSLVITEEMAQKYFGSEEPVDKAMSIDGHLIKVTGVLKNIPHNSHLQFDFIISIHVLSVLGENLNNWGNSNCHTYVQLQKNAEKQDVDQKIAEFLQKKLNIDPKQVKAELYLQDLKKIHLNPGIVDQAYAVVGDMKYVYIFSMIAFFILFIACINFMNLSTARSTNRAKEVGLRKVVGSNRNQLIKQFFGESILLSSIAYIIALILVVLLMPAFNRLSGKMLTVDFLNYRFILGSIAVILITGLLAGGYPAFYLSSFSPANVLKGSLKSGSKGTVFRRVLVVTQFSLSIALIISTVIIYNQLDFMRNRKLGFDKENLVYIPVIENIGKHYNILKNELLQHPGIIGVAAKNSLPINIADMTSQLDWRGKNPEQQLIMEATAVDFDYIETMNLELLEGRNFSKEYPTDLQTYILNEEAVRQTGMESPVGKQFSLWGREGTIIGVVKDAHFRSLKYNIGPQILYLPTGVARRWINDGVVLIRIKGGHIPDAIAAIEKVWENINPNSPFEFNFLDEAVDNQYRAEKRVSQIFNTFTLLAIFISCLGLFGLASFMAEQRTKEIGVRKVMGASVWGLVLLLSKQFAKWVLISNIIAWPIAWYVMNKWLENFAYRINIGWWTFILAGALALVIASLTISYQTFRAAAANPADALRYE